MIYVWASLLLVVNSLSLASNLFSLPGNWLMLVFGSLYLYLQPADIHPRLEASVLIAGLIIAIGGEVWEFVASAAGAKKQGGSRRGAAFSIVASIVGSIVGASLGLPIPVVGPIIGAVGGGAIGAFAGAYYGERDRNHQERMAIGTGAFVGRLMGTAGKLICGLLILVLLTLDSFVDF
ncbi:DUF456 domain-containing protein [Planctomicrobium sp. SH664]|uniref:DUF456 domain-containing protein n=1 Tax=Planctomicrobium sp. SH664 TaxID=3448125 RepID=UPI003F5BD115